MNLAYETEQTLARLWPQLSLKEWTKPQRAAFQAQLSAEFPALFERLLSLYGHHYDLFHYLQQLVQQLANTWYQHGQHAAQSDDRWYQSEETVGIAVYVDLFAGDLAKLKARIPYLQAQGIRYLHLMPLYQSPEGNSDGGYAVSDYRTVNPALGSMEELAELAEALHSAGIKMVLDFVFNHTADDHRWAQAALAGDTRYEEFYYFFDNEKDVAEYNATVREIFPQVRRGSFTFLEKQQRWVWTTFNSFQWDLNYSNPDVFVSVVDEMLFLAAHGCDVLRLDALAFVWKEKGTVCESLPKAHTLIQAFNCCLRIAAPQVLFKSEAIVHPDEVAGYIAPNECELSYNPLAMALQWEALATRRTALLTQSLQKSFAIHPDCTWVNYIRCHDDIGWTWDDAVSARLGIDGADHRRFLNQFYTGRFPGSFASGVAFQENPANGDCRVCGTLASLAGVDTALQAGNDEWLEHALARVFLLNAVNMSLGGIPLLYQGDDLGVLNDFSYLDDPNKRDDARWVNRKPLTEDDFSLAQREGTPAHRIARDLQRLIRLRQSLPVLGRAETRILTSNHPHVFAFERRNEAGECLWVIANYSEHSFDYDLQWAGLQLPSTAQDLLSQDTCRHQLSLGAYQVRWLKP